MRRHFRTRKTETPQSGEDSFLDIISNMVGIMIILVMAAGVQVGSVPETETPGAPELETAAEPVPKPMPAAEQLIAQNPEPAPAEPSFAEKTKYLETMKEFTRLRNDGISLKAEVDELNRQMLNLKNEALGADAEYQGLTADIAAAEAAVERKTRLKTDSEQTRIAQNAELRRLTAESDRLKAEAEQLSQIRPKAEILENMPTPMTKKVEGNEAVFALRGGKISHVPIGYFAERVRGYFRSIRDTSHPHFEETLGPTDGYIFKFRGSLHKHQSGDGRLTMSVIFDEGEFIPSPNIGETFGEASAPDSEFRTKLALYLRESSVITLSVYPDSFELLREIKKFLLENDYTIAIRPMPAGRNIVISPNGTASTTY